MAGPSFIHLTGPDMNSDTCKSTGLPAAIAPLAKSWPELVTQSSKTKLENETLCTLPTWQDLMKL